MSQLNGVVPQKPIHQIVIVGREDGPAVRLGQLADVGGGDGVAVVRGRAAAQLVDQHERVAAGVLQDDGRLGQLDEERRLAAHDVVAGAETREDAVDEVEGARRGGNEASLGRIWVLSRWSGALDKYFELG